MRIELPRIVFIKRYKCLLCGRDKFTRRTPHKCNHGYRKRNIKWVDEVIVVDTSIAEALEQHKPNVFAKGGDRTVENLPSEEIEVCKKYGIDIVCNLGDKIQSSSELVERYHRIKGD
jgi:glycerol-3-phosphate cytidylyltransferase-like family protein